MCCRITRDKTLTKGEDNMKGKFNFKLGALCAILGAMLLMPALGQAKEDSWSEMHKMRRATAIRADQDKMAKSFKSQFDEELALMTPVQQGQYLLTLHKWREEMMEEHLKMKQKKGRRRPGGESH